MTENLILVYAEADDDGGLLPVSLEALGAGRKLCNDLGGKLFALIAGENIRQAADELTHYGADAVHMVDNQALGVYQPEHYISIFRAICRDFKPQAILFANTYTAIDLAPRLAFALDTGLVTDCVDLSVEDGEMIFTKPVYSSNVMSVYSCASLPAMATLRARGFEPPERNDASTGEVIPFDMTFSEDQVQSKVVRQEIQKVEGIPLGRADKIVAGGRGMGGPEGFEMLSELCELLGAALGSSRPPCDLEWTSAKTQVGLTGEIVAPSLYVAVGISGSFQHLAGMADSKVIVAINPDEKANIFKVADYGIVGEYEEIIPALCETLRKNQ